MLAAVQRQIESRSDPDPRTILLIQAAQKGDFVAIELLIVDGANVNGATAVGTTALMTASANGQLAIVRLLLERGSAINTKRSDGFTALLFAIFFRHQDVVRELLIHGANVKAKSRHETSGKMWAAARGFINPEELLGEGARPAQLTIDSPSECWASYSSQSSPWPNLDPSEPDKLNDDLIDLFPAFSRFVDELGSSWRPDPVTS